MKYELTGQLLELAKAYDQKYSDWHAKVMASLQELEPKTIGYIVSSSVFTGGKVTGIRTASDVALEKWRAGDQPGWWTPNRKISIGKKAAKLLASLPKEPDLVDEIMSAMGFKDRCFSLPGCVYSAPGATWLPRTKRAFISWDLRYPSITHPDATEVLESKYYQALEEHKRLESEAKQRKDAA